MQAQRQKSRSGVRWAECPEISTAWASAFRINLTSPRREGRLLLWRYGSKSSGIRAAGPLSGKKGLPGCSFCSVWRLPWLVPTCSSGGAGCFNSTAAGCGGPMGDLAEAGGLFSAICRAVATGSKPCCSRGKRAMVLKRCDLSLNRRSDTAPFPPRTEPFLVLLTELSQGCG